MNDHYNPVLRDYKYSFLFILNVQYWANTESKYIGLIAIPRQFAKRVWPD